MKRFLKKILSDKIYRIIRLLFKTRKIYKGFCNICGKNTIFCETDVIKRGTMECIFCDSISRNRNVAWALLKKINPKKKSIKDMVQKVKTQDISIYFCASYGSIFKYLKNMKNFEFSEYFPDVIEGEFYNGVRCENLEKLTFEDEKFDFVLAEDVMEHVRFPDKAFSEIKRVLRPGGAFIFTVPIYGKTTLKRVEIKDGKDIFVEEPCYHGDPVRKDGVLAYNDFGEDIVARLEKVGFEVEVYNNRIIKSRIYDYVFIANKKGSS